MAVDRQKTPKRAAITKPDDAAAAEQVKEKRTEYLTARQLGEVLQISESTIHRLRRAGRIPAVLLTDRLIRFNLRDVKNALLPAQPGRAQPDGDSDTEQEPSPQISFGELFSGFGIQDSGFREDS